MTFNDFNHFQLKLIDEVLKMRDTKGKEYANSENRFANFDRLSARLGLKNIAIAWVYTTKHIDALENYIKTGQSHSTEPTRGRIVDIITYLTLIAGMIEEANDGIPQPLLKDENSGKHQPFEYDTTKKQIINKMGNIYYDNVKCKVCGKPFSKHLWWDSIATGTIVEGTTLACPE